MAISTVTLMQLYELVMWRSPCTLDHADGINQTISHIAMITNISQPLATAVSMLWAFRVRYLELPWKATFVATAPLPRMDGESKRDACGPLTPCALNCLASLSWSIQVVGISTDDIAAVAAAIIEQGPGKHGGKTYYINGEPYTGTQTPPLQLRFHRLSAELLVTFRWVAPIYEIKLFWYFF
jgi:hypothetical protein